MPYQLECPICRRAASLQARAHPFQAYIHRVLPRSFSAQGPRQAMTPKQRGAAAWALAINKCLQREMALHPRCGACSILMGPGHIEEGIGPFCEAHDRNRASRPIARERP
jgi:hypothetical protein